MMMKVFNQWELFPRGSTPNQVIPGNTNFILAEKFVIPTFGEFDSLTFNFSRLPTYLSHFPAGTSLYTLLHIGQLIDSNRFQHFDHGYIGNLMKYKSLQPPLFHPERVASPVILVFSKTDKLVDPEDVDLLTAQLPNVVARFSVNFSHVDFIWGTGAKEQAWDKFMVEMAKFGPQ